MPRYYRRRRRYARRAYRRRPGRGRRRSYRRRGVPATLPRPIRTRSLVQEHKVEHYESGFHATTDNPGSAVSLVAAMFPTSPQGTGPSEVVGSIIQAKYLKINLYLSWNLAAEGVNAGVRVGLFHVKHPLIHGATYTVGDFYQAENASVTMPVYNKRFEHRCLKDRFYTLDFEGKSSLRKSWYIPVNQMIEFTGSVFDEIKVNDFVLVYFGNNTSDNPFIHYSVRMTYTDS